MKKGILVEVIAWSEEFDYLKCLPNEKYYGESVDKIFVSSAKILRQDQRRAHMRANGIDIARRIFCKANGLDPRMVGKNFTFKIIEQNL